MVQVNNLKVSVQSHLANLVEIEF